MTRHLTAVPAARSSPTALKVKQSLIIGALLVAAAMGPIALLTRPSFPPVDVTGPASRVAAESVGPLALLGAADEFATRFVTGGPVTLPVAQGVVVSTDGLGGNTPVRLGWRRLDPATSGLDPAAYSQLIEVTYVTSRAARPLVISVLVAQSAPVEGRGGWPVLVNEPSVRDYLAVSQPLPPMALAVTGWEPDPTTDTTVVRSLLEQWAQAWAADDSEVLADPAGPMLQRADFDDELRRRRSLAGEIYQPFYGLGGFDVRSLVYTTPQRRMATTPGAPDERLVRVRLDLVSSAPTVNTVNVTLDILLSPQTNKVLAWGPAGSAGSLTPLNNHTINRLPPG